MNLSQLKYAVEVERAGSITQAAENLYMNQPNLSKAIRELEESLGFPIFKRESRGVVPTERGEEFLNSAKRVLAQVERLENRYFLGAETQIPCLKVSMPSGVIYQKICAEYLTAHQGEKLKAEFCETDTVNAIENLVYNGYDLAIIRYLKKYESQITKYLAARDLKHHILQEFSMEILLSKQDPLAQKDRLQADMLQGYTCLEEFEKPLPGILPQESRKEDLHKKGLTVQMSNFSGRILLLGAVPHTFMWAPPVDFSFAEQWGLKQLPCADAPGEYRDALVYKNAAKLSHKAKDFFRMFTV